jgi:hypothetical protein
MLLDVGDVDVVKAARGLHAKTARFWKKADGLNKHPFE